MTSDRLQLPKEVREQLSDLNHMQARSALHLVRSLPIQSKAIHSEPETDRWPLCSSWIELIERASIDIGLHNKWRCFAQLRSLQ